MRVVRVILFAYAGLCIAGGIVLFNSTGTWNLFFAGYLFFNSAAIITGLLFEQHRYKSKRVSTTGWQATGERFIDPGSHRLTEVQYNPKTGERDYREIDSK
jgi:hypothetical protein